MSDDTEVRTPDDSSRLRRRRVESAGRRARGVVRVAGDALHVRRAFGDPVERGEVTIIPVASVAGGSGTGWGSGEMGGGASTAEAHGEGSGSGGGGGFGVRVRPLGVFVVRGSEVQWQPALDLSRVILGGQIVGAVALMSIAWAVRRRRRR